MSILMLLTLLTPFGSDDVWPAFRGTGNSQTQAKNLPLQWSDDQNIAWQVELPGYGQSSPVIHKDRVFVTTMQGDMKETPTLLCYRLSDGESQWKYEFAGTQKVKASDYVSRGAPTPAVDNQGVYAFFESGDLIAVDHQGQPLWKRSLTDEFGEFKGNHGVASSICLTDDAVIVLVAHQGPSYLLAVRKQNGETLWKQDREEKVAWSSPVLCDRDGQPVILISGGGSVEAHDAATGEVIWSFGGLKGNNVPTATVTDELVVIGSNDRNSNLAIRRGGRGALDSSHIAWRTESATSSFGSPLVADGHVYYVNRAGVAFCLDAASGKQQWTLRLGDSCWASPVSAGNRIYFFGQKGKTVVVEPGDEPNVLATNELSTQDRVYGVALVDRRVVLREGRRLTCIHQAD